MTGPVDTHGVWMNSNRITVEQLAQAAHEGRLVFDYQPKVDMNSGLVCGAEALIRWRPESGAVIPPAEFIPLAEDSGYIVELTRLLFPQLIRDFREIRAQNPTLSISFNASALNIADDEFIGDIEKAVRTGAIAPACLEIEVTETATNGNAALLHNLAELAELNVGVAMDDFGQGYASIDAIGRLPFTTIKLDQAIIKRIAMSRKDLIIVESTINLAHQLGLNIVAEGVESAEMFQTLQFAGCGVAQGFWIARPMRLRDFLAFLRQPLQWSVIPVGQVHMVQLDQLRWRKALIDGALSHLHVRKGKPASLQRVPELHPLKSRFGQWYYGPGRRFVGIRWFDALEKPHLAAHKTAGLIVRALEARRPDTEVHALLDELTRLSGAIIHLLARLEDHLVAKVSRRTTTTVRSITDDDLRLAAQSNGPR